ncbi:hypothetical protein E2F47_06090 [Mycobacterium eburneum]|nr:hypothetical protein [Mycobacterium eburneum]TDH56697.1 hypothetical protein E2F47_06090 [Mycobacterium eburneum]
MSTHRLHQRIFLAVVTIGFPLVGTACIGPGWTDKDLGTVAELKIEIPKSATNIVGHTGKGVDFLMPNDQWRDYVAKYYPGTTFTRFPANKETDGSVPLMCIPAFRSGVKLVKLVTGDDIQYRKTKDKVHRTVIVTPDCEPGKAYLQWRLSDAEQDPS